MSDLERLWEGLREVLDPELGLNVVELGLIRRLELKDRAVEVTLTLTSPACPLGASLQEEVEDALQARLPEGFDRVHLTLELDPPWSPEELQPEARRALGWTA